MQLFPLMIKVITRTSNTSLCYINLALYKDESETDESDLEAYPMEAESSEDEEGAYGQDQRTKKSRARKPV